MMRALLLLTGIAASAVSLPDAHAQQCESTVSTRAIRILGTAPDGSLTDQDFPAVAGDRSFFQTLDNGWVFALMRAENGWSLRVYEHERIGDAVDLTSMTPPLSGGVPNPRDIFGWHFRNAANTAANTGDVNAPQHLRAFVISPSLAGTGGFKPSNDPAGPRLSAPGPDAGIGWLRVLDFGLAGLEPGERARMNYLQFEACLSWPRSEAEQSALADAASFEYTETDLETFGSCGLALDDYRLDAWWLPRLVGGDLDGDGSLDAAAQIERRADGRRGMAICRAGTWLELLGFSDQSLGPGVRSDYVGQVEAWQWLGPDDPLPRHLTGVALPPADGDRLILERVEKEAVALYWRDGALRAAHLYHYVEP